MHTLTSKLRSIEYLMTLASFEHLKLQQWGFRHITSRHRIHITISLNASKHPKNDGLKSKTCFNICGLKVGLSIFEYKVQNMKTTTCGRTKQHHVQSGPNVRHTWSLVRRIRPLEFKYDAPECLCGALRLQTRPVLSKNHVWLQITCLF